jgi:SAM-dependent methyltransferase
MSTCLRRSILRERALRMVAEHLRDYSAHPRNSPAWPNRRYPPQMERLLDLPTDPVIDVVSPNDRMVVSEHPESYWEYGPSAVRAIELAMIRASKADLQRILDLPCGHGRVLRYLRASFPAAEVTACDIDKDGVDFCETIFGAVGVYSSDDLSEVHLEGGYDLIWVGSLFTHLDLTRWREFLPFLRALLAPAGLLVFTTHGRWFSDQVRAGRSALPNPIPQSVTQAFDVTGFGFQRNPNTANYGLSFSSPSWVAGEVQRLEDVRLLALTERGWRGVQDVVACQAGLKGSYLRFQ